MVVKRTPPVLQQEAIKAERKLKREALRLVA
jgi:hypothetical protein